MNADDDFEDDDAGADESPFHTRDYRPADAPALAGVFRAAVLTTATARYSPEQCAGWAASADDAKAWAKRLQEAWVRVACNAAGEVVGFGAILMPGHIDQLFTAPAYSRQGVASLILADLLELAAAMGAREISVEASELSRPLLERHGFRVAESGEHCRGGQNLACHRMLRATLIRGAGR